MDIEDFKALAPLFLDSKKPNDEEIAAFTGIFSPTTYYKKNDYLSFQGDQSQNFFYLKSGLVKFVTTKKNGEEVVKRIWAAPRMIACQFAMIDGTAAMFSIQCLEDCEVQIADYRKLLKVFDDYPIWDRFGRIYY